MAHLRPGLDAPLVSRVTGSASLYVDPAAAVEAMKAGWYTHIPLNVFLSSAKRVSQKKEMSNFDDHEFFMSPAEFAEAAGRMTKLILRCYPSELNREQISQDFANHVKALQENMGFLEAPGPFIRFSIITRINWISSIPGKARWRLSDPDDQLLSDLRFMALQGHQRGTHTADGYPLPRLPAVPPAHAVTPYAGSSNRTSNNNSSGSRAAPQPPAQGSFRGAAQSSNSSTTLPRCYACGNRSHLSSECQASNLPWLVRNPSGASHRFSGPGGTNVCFTFNCRPGGCRWGDRCRNSHRCTLCGKDDGHSAQSCPARTD